MPWGFCEHCDAKIQGDTWDDLKAKFGEHLKVCPALKPKSIPLPTSMDEEGWEEKLPAFMTFDEPGEEIIGILEQIDTITLHDKEVRRASVRTKEGIKTFLLTVQLETLLLDVTPGTEIKVQYLGETLTGKKRKVKTFRVWTR